MWFPDWLYERFPLLYVASSVACLCTLKGSSFATFSAVLLFVAGALVFMQRRLARTAAGASAVRPRRYHGMAIGVGKRD